MNAEPAAAPVCVYCWPVLRVAVHENRGLPCCDRRACLTSTKPAIPSFMLKPRPVSMFEEQAP